MFQTTVLLRRLSALYPVSPGPRVLSRTIHANKRSPNATANPVAHGAENYFVDNDDTPPPNGSVYKVDASSEAAQSAYEPPSGPWNRAGAGTVEYSTLHKADEPYGVPPSDSQDRDATKLRYGGRKEKLPETSKADEGPEGAERGGRKPEGRA